MRICRQRKAQRTAEAERKRILNRAHKQRERLRKSITPPHESPLKSTDKSAFKHRTEKHRALKSVKKALSISPAKRTEVLKSYILSSPTCNQIINRAESKSIASDEILADVKKVIDKAKNKRTDEARTAVAMISASFSGENISKAKLKSKIAKNLVYPGGGCQMEVVSVQK